MQNEEAIIREDLVSYISDAFKDLNGCRPRFLDTDQMTTQELRDYAESLSNRIDQAVEEELVEERGYNEDAIQEALAMGAPDRETAIRWFQ